MNLNLPYSYDNILCQSTEISLFYLSPESPYYAYFYFPVRPIFIPGTRETATLSLFLATSPTYCMNDIDCTRYVLLELISKIFLLNILFIELSDFYRFYECVRIYSILCCICNVDKSIRFLLIAVAYFGFLGFL